MELHQYFLFPAIILIAASLLSETVTALFIGGTLTAASIGRAVALACIIHEAVFAGARLAGRFPIYILSRNELRSYGQAGDHEGL